MSEPIPFLSERDVARQAIAALERGDRDQALKLVGDALSRRKAPAQRHDPRSDDIVWVRACMEQAEADIKGGSPDLGLRRLRRALGPDPNVGKSRSEPPPVPT